MEAGEDRVLPMNIIIFPTRSVPLYDDRAPQMLNWKIWQTWELCLWVPQAQNWPLWLFKITWFYAPIKCNVNNLFHGVCIFSCFVFKRRQVASIGPNVCWSVCLCVEIFFKVKKIKKSKESNLDFSMEGFPFLVIKLLKQINQKIIK